VHAVRRNTNMVYVVENNGVYGLTKGQFSATSDKGAHVKSGEVNDYPEIDLCQIALDLGCGFVARSFSGDGKQMVALLRAAIAHKGFALIDAIALRHLQQPPGQHPRASVAARARLTLHELGFVAPYEGAADRQAPGDHQRGHADGSHLMVKKLAEHGRPAQARAAAEGAGRRSRRPRPRGHGPALLRPESRRRWRTSRTSATSRSRC
jgi:2-oxoglutarate ferredoxin oxidoreductase subunit beta